ncbi:MAG: hypothetical protein K940chlam2_01411 [Chlamydiae bacterium]|nr:hypothetical protein [Chlamydiota bacterium]
MTENKTKTTIPIYVPARQSIYNVKADELQIKLDNLRKNDDVLMRFFFVLSLEEEVAVRASLMK